MLTEDEKGFVFYEVKFRKKPITDSMIEEEIGQVKATGLIVTKSATDDCSLDQFCLAIE